MMEENPMSLIIVAITICAALVLVYALDKPIKKFTKDVK